MFVLFVFVPDFRDVTASRSMAKHNGIRLLNKKPYKRLNTTLSRSGRRYFVIRLISQMSRPDLPVMQSSDDVGRDTIENQTRTKRKRGR